MTTQTFTHGTAGAIRLIDRVRARAEMTVSGAREMHGRYVRERTISGLSAEQLDDIGILTRVEPKPVLTVKAGLMANLLSLR